MDNFKPELTNIKVVTILSPTKVSVLYNFPKSRLHDFEQEIGKFWDDASTFCNTKTIPKPSMFVAVKEDNGTYKRGYVESVVACIVEVFLCDYGTFVFADDLQKMMPLKDEHKYHLAYYSTVVVIPGLVPARVMKLSTGEKLVYRFSANWSLEAHTVVKSWFTDSEVALSVFKFQNPALTYGDFYKRGSKSSLSASLCERNLALVEQQLFDMIMFRDPDKSATTCPKPRKEETREERLKSMEKEMEWIRSKIERLTVAFMEKEKKMESGQKLLPKERNSFEEELQKYKNMLTVKQEEINFYKGRQSRRQQNQ